jgi:hypothetical protein
LSRRKRRSISLRFLVTCTIMAPAINAIRLGRHHRDHVQREHQLTCFVAFVSAILDHWHARERAQIAKHFTAFGRIVGIARRECEGYCGPSIRGNHMNLGGRSIYGVQIYVPNYIGGVDISQFKRSISRSGAILQRNAVKPSNNRVCHSDFRSAAESKFWQHSKSS